MTEQKEGAEREKIPSGSFFFLTAALQAAEKHAFSGALPRA